MAPAADTLGARIRDLDEDLADWFERYRGPTLAPNRSRWRPGAPSPATTRPRARPRRALRCAAGLLLVSWHATTGRHTWRTPTEQDRRYLAAMIVWGYEASDLEQGHGQREVAGQVGPRDAAPPRRRGSRADLLNSPRAARFRRCRPR